VSRYRDQVAEALSAVTIRGSTRYAWHGRASRPIAASVDAALDDSERRRYLVSCLREELYWSFYCRGWPGPARWGEPEPVSPDPRLARALSGANAGQGSWEPGWTLQRVEGDEAVVSGHGLRMRLAVADCRAAAGGLAPCGAVNVRMPKDLPARSPGFFMVVGDAGMGSTSGTSIVRVYWNVTRAGAPALVRSLTSRLNAEGTRFHLKVADHPYRLDRCDSAVLYLPSSRFAALRPGLREVATALRPQLRPGIPAFTLELAPGVGLAEQNAGGESFGFRRCAWLADAIVRAHEGRLADPAARLAEVVTRFAEEGVDIDAPYLEPSLDTHVL
jgi:HopA1 effector protein family